MSRIGKTPVEIPQGVTVTVASDSVSVKGPKGQLAVPLPHGIAISQEASVLTIEKKTTDPKGGAIHGLVRALVSNAVLGVSKGWTKTLELTGVGYRAAMTGSDLTLTVGFSHPVTITPPAGITLAVADGKIVVTGIDRQAVGQVAADIRAVRPPEPYKGKGIHYLGERIRRKAGKAAKAVGGAGAK